MRRLVLALLAAAAAAPQFAAAQDLEAAEVIVTGSRIDQDDYSNAMPAVGLRRPADFLVQPLVIRGDTRDAPVREREIRTMMRDAIRRAEGMGIELAYGTYILTRLTAANADDVVLSRDRRPDSEQVSFLAKAKLGGEQSGAAAEAQIKRFVESVPEVGRAQMDAEGDSTLSVVGPDSYRPQIATAVAADAKTMAAKLGADYAVEIEGLNMPVQWARSGPAEVLLYVPYTLRIVPRP